MKNNSDLAVIAGHKFISLPDDITVGQFIGEIVILAGYFDYRNKDFSNIKCTPELSQKLITEADNLESEELLVIKALVNDLIEMLEEYAKNGNEYTRLRLLAKERFFKYQLLLAPVQS